MQPGDDAPNIAQRAFAALNSSDLEEAQMLAQRLRELKYSAYFEIQALIYLQRDELEPAIEVLREGVELAPSVWLLWQLLGNSLSDNSQFEEALRCYEHALELDVDEEDRASILLNQATVLSRTGRDEAALALLDSLLQENFVDNGLLSINIELLSLTLWSTCNRCDDVAMRARRLEEMLRRIELAPDDDFRLLSQSWSRGAQILLECGFIPRARAWAQEALEIFKANQGALEILRLSNPDAPLAKRYFQVILEGEEEEKGFLVSYSVVARDANEANTLSLAMETPHHQKAPSVSECRALGTCTPTPIGVYKVSGYSFSPLVAEDD